MVGFIRAWEGVIAHGGGADGANTLQLVVTIGDHFGKAFFAEVGNKAEGNGIGGGQQEERERNIEEGAAIEGEETGQAKLAVSVEEKQVMIQIADVIKHKGQRKESKKGFHIITFKNHKLKND